MQKEVVTNQSRFASKRSTYSRERDSGEFKLSCMARTSAITRLDAGTLDTCPRPARVTHRTVCRACDPTTGKVSRDIRRSNNGPQHDNQPGNRFCVAYR